MDAPGLEGGYWNIRNMAAAAAVCVCVHGGGGVRVRACVCVCVGGEVERHLGSQSAQSQFEASNSQWGEKDYKCIPCEIFQLTLFQLKDIWPM